jgi:protein-S-isoprenylcysteine O-methyltransferase Ste14
MTGSRRTETGRGERRTRSGAQPRDHGSSAVHRAVAPALLAAAGLLGWGSLLAFIAFLFTGSSPLSWTEGQGSDALWWDAGLSLAFFAVHSGLVRRSFRAWSARFVPEVYGGAVYAIASGAMLIAVLLLWRTAEPLYAAPPGAVRWTFRAAFALAALVFLWGGLSLRGFDPCGLRPILHRLRNVATRPMPFSARGPYRWVRHPLYSAMIVMAWSCPDLTADRLLFDVLWTAWMVAATTLEERDLVAQFGQQYRDYQRRVPMLVPGARGPLRDAPEEP